MSLAESRPVQPRQARGGNKHDDAENAFMRPWTSKPTGMCPLHTNHRGIGGFKSLGLGVQDLFAGSGLSPSLTFFTHGALANTQRSLEIMDGQQLEALERTIASGSAVLTDRHAALLALCRELARLMDDRGTDAEPSTRVIAAYLSALKDLGRALAVPEEKNRVGGKLSQLRVHSGPIPMAAQGGRAPGKVAERGR